MDEQVLAAMARWPNVPAVYGWLSLTERGDWRLHPNGDALQGSDSAPPILSAGEAITSPPILSFINRNYACDEAGRWYFQNGPQRVFVRLDAAPYIFRTTGTEDGSPLAAHTGQRVEQIQSWWLDEEGRLYAQTDLGPGLITGRDLMMLYDRLDTVDGQALGEVLENGTTNDPIPVRLKDAPSDDAIPLHRCRAVDIPDRLRFVRFPR